MKFEVYKRNSAKVSTVMNDYVANVQHDKVQQTALDIIAKHDFNELKVDLADENITTGRNAGKLRYVIKFHDHNLGEISEKQSSEIREYLNGAKYSAKLDLRFWNEANHNKNYSKLTISRETAVAIIPPKKKRRWVWPVVIAIISLMILGGTTSDSIKKSATDNNSAVETTKAKTTTRTETEMTAILFATKTQDDAILAKGATKTVQVGVNGEKTTTYEVVYDANGKEISRKVIKEETTKEPVDEIIANGTYVAPVRPANNTNNTNNSTTQNNNSTTTTIPYYANCAALNVDYPHGVGRAGAVDKVASGNTPVTNFAVNEAVYSSVKTRLDRDNDGIACER